MNDRKRLQLINRYRGIEFSQHYDAYRLNEPELLVQSANDILTNTPQEHGTCALMSAAWSVYLQDRFGIPAIVVAGDLKINKTRVFKCKKNIPEPKINRGAIAKQWDGHCWIEIDGIIGDISLFRTAYAIQQPSVLKKYVVSEFGYDKGVMISPFSSIPSGMKYVPKFILNDTQVNGLLAGYNAKL